MADYVSNADLLEHLTKRRIENSARELTGLPKLPIDDYLGKVILEIATRLSYRPNFIQYTYRQDMIGDAVENLLKVVDNFDYQKSKYPFAYFTQIAWHAYVRRIQAEQKQQKIKGALVMSLPIEDLFDTNDVDDDGVAYKTHFVDYLRDNNFPTNIEEIKEIEKVKELVGVELFMDIEE
jgi:DNA-directed RNA polymerase specialized sigma24 family protein